MSRLAAVMDDAKADRLADMGFPAPHRAKIYSNNPLEQHDEWAVQRRHMSLETLAPLSDTAPVSLPPVAS